MFFFAQRDSQLHPEIGGLKSETIAVKNDRLAVPRVIRFEM